MSDVKVSYGDTAAAETPSAVLAKDMNRVVVVIDRRGRQLGVRDAKRGLAYFRLARLLGTDAQNPAVLRQAVIYASVVSIDGDPVPFPTSSLQLDALVDRLDLDGFDAANQAQGDAFGHGVTSEEAVETAKN